MLRDDADSSRMNIYFRTLTETNWLSIVWKQVFECVRRLLLTGLLVFFAEDAPGQVAFSCIFAVIR